MPDPSNTELALQICFGIFGMLGTIATLASLHHRDSLGCILIRRWIQPRRTRMIPMLVVSPLCLTDRYLDHDGDIEATAGAYEDANEQVNTTVPFERRTTLPPAYEQCGPSSLSHVDSFDDAASHDKVGEVSLSKDQSHTSQSSLTETLDAGSALS